MNHEALGIYKVRIPFDRRLGIFAALNRMLTAFEWLKDEEREDAFINAYINENDIVFVLNDLDTALLMRLSTE